MNKRISIGRVEPDAYKAMLAFDKYLDTTGLTRIHRDLIKVRTSQVNGCAYCVDKHIREALEAGENEQRIHALVVWRETPFFTEEERALLALTEEVTLIQHHVSDETYSRAAELLGEQYLAQVIMAIISMNAWNRIGISTAMQPALRHLAR
jgi:AhpD family alkylhydroperoxidase